MPLSEQEQRMLDEMERHLLSNDADVVSAPRDGRAISYRNIVYGALAVLLGLGGLIVGVALQLVVVGVIGFALMLGGVILAVTPSRSAAPPPGADATPGPAPQPKASGNFMDRMNDRWDRRQEGR